MFLWGLVKVQSGRLSFACQVQFYCSHRSVILISHVCSLYLLAVNARGRSLSFSCHQLITSIQQHSNTFSLLGYRLVVVFLNMFLSLCFSLACSCYAHPSTSTSLPSLRRIISPITSSAISRIRSHQPPPPPVSGLHGGDLSRGCSGMMSLWSPSSQVFYDYHFYLYNKHYLFSFNGLS